MHKEAERKAFDSMQLKVKKLREDAVLPRKAHPGDAGFDLTAVTTGMCADGTKLQVGFGIAVEIPEGYVGLVFPRSSIYKTDCRLANAVGVIDSGYRGELKAVFDFNWKTSTNLPKRYVVGDRCCQLVLVPVPEVEVQEVTELTPSDRGEGGFGSTNVEKELKRHSQQSCCSVLLY